ncbi:hypothetical protein pb186bvf_019429 [Paramecium bursaria]
MQEQLEKLTTKKYTQLEELELMRGKIVNQGNTSNRYKNQSSNALALMSQILREKESEHKTQDNLNQSRKYKTYKLINQQINGISRNSMNSSVVQIIQEQPEFESPQIRSPLIVHEEEHLQEPESPQKLHNRARKPSRTFPQLSQSTQQISRNSHIESLIVDRWSTEFRQKKTYQKQPSQILQIIQKSNEKRR